MRTARSVFAAAAIVLALAAVASARQAASNRAEVALQAAIKVETIDGDLKAAIEAYKKVAATYGSDRAVAARALVRAGQCYEKLGEAQATEARVTYTRVVREFAEQAELVAQARARLAALAGPVGTTLTTRRLENPPADTAMGAVSPDGRHYSFWDWRTGDLAVRDLQTSQDRRLTDEGTEGRAGSSVSQWAGESTWSSDSKRVAYAWYFAESGAVRAELRIVGLDGGKPLVLSRDDGMREIGGLAWSPDGKYIAASVHPQNGSVRMELFSTAGNPSRTLADLKRDISSTKRFSPDSRYIAYDRGPDELSPERDIFLMSVDSGQSTSLIQHPADDYLLGWSPDGKWTVFASDRTGTLGLWVVGMSGAKTRGEPRLVRPGIDPIQPIGLTRSGALYYGVVRATEDVYVVDLDPTTGKLIGPERKAIEQFEGGNFSPSYSPDGKYLAYMSRRGNSP
jgi:Tol biopolymer transport system component